MNRAILALILVGTLVGCKESPFLRHSKNTLPPDPAPQAAGLTLDELIAKYAAARGGKEKLDSIQAARMKGTWESKQVNLSTSTVTIAPGRFLRRTEPGDGIIMIKAVDGDAAWEVSPQTGIEKPTPMIPQEASRYRRLADPQGPLINYQQKGNKVELVGKMPWQTTQVYKVKVTYPDKGENYLYLDASTFLPVRLVQKMYVAQLSSDVDIEFLFHDYRDVQGVKWPFKETANAPEVNYAHTLTWKTIEINPPVDLAVFKSDSFVPPKS
jgi:hypothetical protein